MLGCVVAGFCDEATRVATIGAVAERFAVGGKLSLAVPLLFLIGKGGEACTRLQGVGRWEYAATAHPQSTHSPLYSCILLTVLCALCAL
jgi:hypothetical protein